uniref:Calponin-homology (CH) domain-containing protein n=1 Tax=Acrobeloides nanus TaxID=290746 RepID=A0A914D222_9BILA
MRFSAVSHDAPLDESTSVGTEARSWDIFRLLPPPPDNIGKGFWHDASLQLLKISTFFILFLLTLGSAVVAKSSFFLMTSAIGYGGRNMTICTDKIPEAKINTVFISNKHVAKWVWGLYMALCVPELICFIRCFHRTLFRNVKRPSALQFFTVLLVESLHAFGVGMLVFHVLPDLPAETGAMISNALCMVPSVLSIFSRKAAKMTLILIIFDVAAAASQSSGFWAWPVLVPEIRKHVLVICVSLCLISLAWWQNFVHTNSFLPPIRRLGAFANCLSERRSKTYVVVSLWKSGNKILYLRMKFDEIMQRDPFGEKLITITAKNLNSTQINHFLQRMHEFETPPDPRQSKNKVFGSEELEEKPRIPTTKKPWNPDDDEAIDAGEYEKPEKAKKVDPNPVKRNRREVVEEEEEVISAYQVYDDYVELNQFTSPYDALWIALIQIGSVIICYHSSKFACKVMMQRMGFALPIALAVPATVAFLSTTCEQRMKDPCHMTGILTKELFWQCPAESIGMWDFYFWMSPQTWIWLTWLVSQLWVTIHLWTPKHERLARSEKYALNYKKSNYWVVPVRLFILSYYNGAFVDQSLAFNRRRDDKAKIKAEFQDLELENEESSQTYETIGPGQIPKPPPSVCSVSSSKIESGLIRDVASSADAITKIYACATMWHETPHEMTCMLKSIFRLDEDQCARRNAQKYLKVIDPDYYEFEAHIFFDDAFDLNDYGEPVVNKFVKQLVEKIDEAASAVHQTQMRLKSPKKAITPYGGRISYVLPGKNRLTIHLKDKNKIRHRKRWSQINESGGGTLLTSEIQAALKVVGIDIPGYQV